MAKAKRRKTKQAHGPKPVREQCHGAGADANKLLTAQNRRLLGKHYANKYRVGG
jgi:hypothetical protein